MVNTQSVPNDEGYEITLKGHLDESWADWFDGMTFVHEADGTTTLSGEIVDQAALYGLLKKIRDLGMPLLSVNQIESSRDDAGGETNG